MVSLNLSDGLELDCQMEILSSRLYQLELAIRESHSRHVPPPYVFNGSQGYIEDFIFLFERYCLSEYGEDQLSWLQVLPLFLEGEPRDIVVAFGLDSNISYNMVKERLKWELKEIGLQDRFYLQFCTATKNINESYSCFSIRLEVLLGRVSYLTSDVQRFLVISKFLSCLPQHILDKVTIEVALQSNVTIRQLVTLVKNIHMVVDGTGNDTEAEVLVTEDLSSRKKFPNRNKCFRCKLFGHFKVNCTAKVKYCKYCKQYHHRSVKCRTGSKSDLVSSDYRDSKVLFNIEDSMNDDVGLDESMKYSSSTRDFNAFNRNVGRNCIGNSSSRTSPHVKIFNPNQVSVGNIKNEMGIDWNKLKFIPFFGGNKGNVHSSPNTSDVDHNNAIPYIDSRIEWWELEDDNADSFSDESLFTSESSTKFSDSSFGKAMDSDSDSGISSMVCCVAC